MNSITTEPVSLLRRLGAVLYDGMLIGATVLIVGGILGTLLSRLLGLPEIAPGTVLAKVMFLTEIFMAYLLFGWFWTHGGQTLGMRAWKIRVLTEDGYPLNWQQSFFRFVAALFSWVALGVGFWVALADPEKLTWHDRFSRTRLVRV